MRNLRMLSLGLAISLLFAQTSHAAVFITPFGEKIEVAETGTAQEVILETLGEDAPGTVAGPGAASEPGTVHSGSQAGTGGPGTMPQKYTQVIQPSASYSTKEPVSLNGNASVVKPTVSAQGAVLYDVTHDKFLYEKNADTKYYPASITKVLTALLVLENARLDETVTFSKTAVTDLESGAVTLNIKEGDKVSVEDCLYGLMLKSANEVANGLAEHVGGSLSGFSDMMNAKAKELGCTNSNFVNPNGLNNTNHLTTARDMAKIAAAAFENETFCKIVSTTSYQFPATQAAGERTISMGHKMLYPNDSRYYDGIVGGKTGYTSKAGNTLVTCVERDGVRMVAVILKTSGTHYADTKAMLDYGFGVTGYHKWIADGPDWRFELADGTRLSNCFVTIDGKEYAFDMDGKMVTGWLTLGQNWYYFGDTGAMIRGDWRQDGGLWFYLGEDGAMMKNAWIDNQYYVGADGVWVE